MRAYENNKTILPSCRSLKAEDIWGSISAARFFLVGTDVALVVPNSTICPDGALLYDVLQMKGLVYTLYGKYIRLFFPPWMGWPQYLDQSNQWISSIQFFSLLKWAQDFSFFGVTRLAVSKTYPAVIGSSCNIYEMLPLLSRSILYHHILPLLRLRKNSASALRTSWHPGYDENIFICGPLLPWPTCMSNLFRVWRGPQIYQNWTIGGGDNWGWCCKKWQEHSFVSDNVCEAIAKIGLLDLTNRTWFKKVNS